MSKPMRWALAFFTFCLALGSFQAAARQTTTTELRTVAAIRQLSVEQTQQRIPVRLRGVVTFFDESLYSRFIQDETAGIYLQFPLNVAPPMLGPGQMVELTGVVNPGEYAPVVLVSNLSVVGLKSLPAAKQVTYQQLANGTEDSQFVEISGIVRSVRKVETSRYHEIEIVTGGGRFLAFAADLPVQNAEELIDSTVQVRGVCSTQFNHQRQLFAIRLMVPRPDDLKIETPAPRKPFDIPARPIGSLLQFTPQETFGHRVKVTGTVICFEPGEVVFLQSGNYGLEVKTSASAPLKIGDQVEVLGFISRGVYTPLLEDASYRVLSSGQPPAPPKLTADEALRGEHDCQLIQVSAKLIDRTQHGNEKFLILQESNVIFQASLKQASGRDGFADLQNESRVTVTGVCRIEPGEWQAGSNWRAKSFSILMRSPEDIVLVQSPPWWTLKKVLWIAAAWGFVAVSAFAWVGVLRRQVAERTHELEIQIQKRQLADRQREIEQERARVAQDLHDDLGAGLTEVNMLTTLVKSPATSPEEKNRYLGDLSETARHMVTSLDEIVWAVNPRNDTTVSLASYFGSYAQRLLDLASVACGLDIEEELPDYSLDPKFRQELFLAFKEALTNVVRHAGATQVWLRISVQGEGLVVEISDNGRGFNSGERQAGNDGIANMEQRLKSLGGDCQIKSNAEKGITVRFNAPLPRKLL